MTGEFTKPTSIAPAVVGAIADPDVYNQNIAGQSKGSLVCIDADGNFVDGDIGDENLGLVGTLINNIKLRVGGVLKFYNASGVFQNDVNLGQATESLIGQAEIATQAETDAGSDDTKFVTPLKLEASVYNNKQLIETQTASSSTTIDFTGLSSNYLRYIVEMTSVKMGTNDVTMRMRMSSNDGSSYDSGATDYQWRFHNPNAQRSDQTAEYIEMVDFGTSSRRIGNAAGEYANGAIDILNPSFASAKCMVFFNLYYIANTEGSNFNTGTGMRNTAKAINAIRLFPSSGNFTSGTFKLYGVK